MRLQQQPNGQFQLTIPKDIAIGLNWKKHDVLNFRLFKHSKIIILGFFKPMKKGSSDWKKLIQISERMESKK